MGAPIVTMDAPRWGSAQRTGCTGLRGADMQGDLRARVSSTSHASRRSVVARGNKRIRTVVAGVEMKAGSSFHRGCLWGNGEYVSPQRPVDWVRVGRYIR